MLLACLALPCALASIAIESSIARRLGLPLYHRRDTITNVAMGIGGLAMGAVGLAISMTVSMALYSHRILELDHGVGTWVALILAEDLCYYWFHRVSHRLPVFWAAHETHHSSRRYNLSTALRLSWTTPFTGLPFWWILPLIGFHPAAIVAVHGFSLAYQFVLHTQLVGTLGPLEWVLNTPSHHRVHHGCDPEYLDTNFGGILIVWDRMFGTFAKERRAPTYGLTSARRRGGIDVAFGAWRALCRDVFEPGLTVSQRLGRLFRHPPPPQRPESAP